MQEELVCRAEARWSDAELGWLGLWPRWGYSPGTFARARRSYADPGALLTAPASQLEARLGAAGAARAATIQREHPTRSAAAWSTGLLQRGHAEVDRLGPHRWIVASDRGPWREALEAMGSPPPWLYGQGDPAALSRPLHEVIAVVGTRRCDTRGARIAREIAQAAVEGGCVVASGGAAGIDTAAHEATLQAGGEGLVVLGVGLEHPYPARNAPLFDQIAAAGGAVITPFHLQSGASRYHFPRRNAILAALAGATVVVQAGARSGALITADHALRYKRKVLAVPGDTESELSLGANRLLLLGASPLVEPRRVQSFIDCAASGARQLALPWDSAPSPAAAPRLAEPPPDGVAGQVWSCMDASGVHVSELVAASRLSIGVVSTALLELELEGRVTRLAGGRYARRQEGG